jgi:hypothetical protein
MRYLLTALSFSIVISGASSSVSAKDLQNADTVPQAGNASKKVCRRQQATGTILPSKRVCRTEGEWSAIDKANANAVNANPRDRQQSLPSQGS